MRVTIIRDDNKVVVDGEGYTVDCTALPVDFHALQWDGTSGEVEYRMTVCSHCSTRSKKPNLFVNDMTPYLPYVDAWTAAKATAAAVIAAHEEATRVLAEVQAEATALQKAEALAKAEETAALHHRVAELECTANAAG